MSNQHEAEIIKKINDLHSEIVGGSCGTTLANATQIGEFLAEQKERLKTRAWVRWVEENLIFKERTALEYVIFFYHPNRMLDGDQGIEECIKMFANPDDSDEVDEDDSAEDIG